MATKENSDVQGVSKGESKSLPKCEYHSYLNLEEILHSQSPRSEKNGKMEHDEMLFIVIHQVFELWFKVSLHELTSIIEILEQLKKCTEKDLCLVVERLQRLKEIWKVQVSHFPIIETLTPMNFMDFRGLLSPASGFDSAQFRMIEISLGLREDKRSEKSPCPYIQKVAEKEKCAIEELKKKPNLFDALDRWLARTPGLQDMPEKPLFSKLPFKDEWEKNGKHRMSREAMKGALLIHHYRFQSRYQMPYQILLLIKDLDGLINKWRYHHVLMVHRIIGDLPGTGGTASGYRYLESTVNEDYRIFTDLCGMAAYVLPTSEVPDLTDEDREKLSLPKGNLW